MNKDFYTAIKDRRTIYNISKEEVVSKEKIEEIINHAVMHTPSAFNSQSARVVILFGDNHDMLWDITKETLRKLMPENRFAATEEKMKSFRNGYGTVLYFNDDSVVEGLQQKFPKYKDSFPIWAQHAVGMLQFAIWTSLEIEGLGASLQHYNPLIDEAVKQQWNLPAEWTLIAQMPFGKPTAAAGEKQFLPLEERVKIFK
jgi:uncharacterized protein